MSEPFIAEIKIFAGNFAPRGWAFCDGSLLQIAQNTALFALVGTTYGGDGRTTMGLPDLQGRAPMHPGNGPGLTSRRLGERGGTKTETLSESQMANHTHTMQAVNVPASSFTPTSTSAIARSVGGNVYQQNTTANLVNLHADTLSDVGGGQSHNNLQPLLTLHYIIALVGIFPPRN